MHITPDNRIEPNGAIIAHFHFTYHRRVIRQKTIFPKHRGMAPNRLN
jgi:hypothetical protein